MASPKQNYSPPIWERVIAAIGLLLVLGSLGFLIFQGVWGDNSPPDITIRLVRIVDSGDDYLVEFKARNQGGTTAAEVGVSATLRRDGHEVEIGEVTLDYVSAGSERQGGLYFSNDPRLGQLEFKASGYRIP